MTLWTAPFPDPTPADLPDPLTGPERSMLEATLASGRAGLLNVCAGLDVQQLAARPLPTSMSLVGLVRHLTKVERVWLRIRAAGQDVPNPFPEPDSDFDGASALTAQADLAAYQAEWLAVDAAVADLPLDTQVEARGQVLSLRRVHLHLHGEYQRHLGHADLIREALDGVTGR